MTARFKYFTALSVLLLLQFPARVAGSPSYEKEMWRLLAELEFKSIADGCISDDIPSARRALGESSLAYLLDHSEIHRHQSTLTLKTQMGSSSWCGLMDLPTYTQSIEIDANLPSCSDPARE